MLSIEKNMVVSHDHTSKQERIILRTHMSLIEGSKNCRLFLHTGEVSTVAKNNDNNVLHCCFDMLM